MERQCFASTARRPKLARNVVAATADLPMTPMHPASATLHNVIYA
jgi:hypothetical protein